MKEGQDAIYYIAGDDATKVAASPHLEGFRAKGVEVLLLSDPVDEFWMQHVTEFDGKPFKSITRGAADLDDIKSEGAKDDEKKGRTRGTVPSVPWSPPSSWELGDAVKDVRPSKRLTESVVCLVGRRG